MHPPKKPQKLLAIYTKLSMCGVPPRALYYQQMNWGLEYKGKIREDRIEQIIFTKIIAFPCSVYYGRPDILNAGSWV
ncbi:unnamed protein product [Staurois parvus]|uniref:Uncharacterized protein n=1 Tax=Staurois parvus TaxID=386267 RepID=A0ABN9AW20_9NEOB|nr:unnamed protein product [Staurois parvus]